MRIPARCNRRSCQARRNLSKPPENYVRWPRCHYANCPGKMYVDKYRLKKGPRDHPPVCYRDCLPHPHRVDTDGCLSKEDWILERAFLPVSKHSPVREPIEF